MERENLAGLQCNYLKVLKYIGNDKWECECVCGKHIEVRQYELKNNIQKSCGCKRGIDHSGEIYGELEIVKKIKADIYLCRCSCGVEKEMHIKNILSGHTQSCGHIRIEQKREHMRQVSRNKVVDIKGQTSGDWIALEYKGEGNWLCECKVCGYRLVMRRRDFERKRSCVHTFNGFNNIRGKKINSWTVLRYAGDKAWECKCECGNVRVVKTQRILSGDSKSCGCARRRHFLNSYNIPDSTIDIISNKDSFIALLNKLTTDGGKPTLLDVANELNVSYPLIVRYIVKYKLHEYIQIVHGRSYMETEVANYIRSLGIEIETNCKGIIPNLELDIYIPSHKVAIEFNGNYWHSSLYKEKRYHQDKTLKSARNGIRLIHIFEYEWVDEVSKNKIKELLRNILTNNSVVYARNTYIRELDTNEYKEFLENWHLQGYVQAKLKLGAFSRETNELIGVISLGTPRFDRTFDYEIIRLAWKCRVVGGLEKFISYTNTNYKVSSLVSYVDIAKFTGNSYTRVGFKVDKVTEPGYVWVDSNNKVLSRYQTQKSKLIELGIGDINLTEDEIMSDLGFLKIYNCGNLRLIWGK